MFITAQRPQVEYYTDHFFIISEMVYEEPDRKIALEQLSIFLGDSYVLTLQEIEYDVFDQVRSRLRLGRGYARKMKADYLACALLDATVDQFFPILETVGESIEAIEEELLRSPREIPSVNFTKPSACTSAPPHRLAASRNF